MTLIATSAFRSTLLALALVGFTAPLRAATAPNQASFASADEAAAALVDAAKQGDEKQLLAVLGPGSETLVDSGDRYADAESRQRFVAAYQQQHKLVAAGPDRMVLDVGPNDWPLPIPLVQASGRWHFDSPAGAQELVNRRIGRNEIAAIRTALAYVDAQKAYFALTGKTGQPVYAQRLVSTQGKRDGLYWPATSADESSPLAGLVAQAEEEGYPGATASGKPIPYQGYMFRILTAQGTTAPGGAKDYIVNGRMTGGFALVAWPAAYGSSGIMTFIVNQDGVVFQKDQGPRTEAIAGSMKRFDPDLSWTRVDVVNQ
jgi:hypothetical protein